MTGATRATPHYICVSAERRDDSYEQSVFAWHRNSLPTVLPHTDGLMRYNPDKPYDTRFYLQHHTVQTRTWKACASYEFFELLGIDEADQDAWLVAIIGEVE